MSSVRRAAAAVAALALGFAPSAAIRARADAPLAGAAPTVVPMTLANDHVYIAVEIDGKGPYQFVLDSGAPFGLLDRSVASDLGLAVRERGTIGGVGDATTHVGETRVRSFSIGGRNVAATTFAVVDLHETLGRAEGRRLDGVIGRDLLRESVTTIDYARGTVALDADFAAQARAGASVAPLSTHDGLPQIPCRVAGVAGNCTVDTGSRLDVTVLSPFVRSHPEIAPAHPSAHGVDGFGLGGAAYGRLALLPTLAFAGFTLRDTIADFSTQTRGAFADPQTAANVGSGVWRRFVVTFDEPHDRIALRPGDSFGAPERYDRSGLFLVGDAFGGIVVLDVRDETAAARAGLRAGDELVARDGVPLRARDLPSLRDDFSDPGRTRVTLRVARDGVARDVTLELGDFVR